MMKPLMNTTLNLQIAAQVEDAKNIFSRMKGLLGREGLASTSTLWIEPCNSIHTCFMKFSIDAIFVDRDLKVCKVVRDMRPWRLVLPVIGAHSVFELASGQAGQDKVREGDQLHVGG